MRIRLFPMLLFLLLPGLVLLFRPSSTPLRNLAKKITNNINRASEFSPFPLSSLESIFQKDHSWVATLSAQHVRALIATGDVIPARTVNFEAVKRNSFTWAFEKTADIVKNADITFINLETPLFSSCPATTEGMVFCGSDKHIEGLKLIGADIASIANNHAGNRRMIGIADTIKLLTENGIEVTGSNNFVLKDVRGMKFAFLGFNDIGASEEGISWADKDSIKKQIASARRVADIVIVQYHWGVEYRSQPDDRQKELGHFTVDSGADLVIGNHPHWIQPVEFYRGKLITYAHGNYIFDQMWSQKTREGVIGKYTFFDKKLIDTQYFPLVIFDWGQARFAEGLEKKRLLDEMRNESIKLSQFSP